MTESNAVGSAVSSGKASIFGRARELKPLGQSKKYSRFTEQEETVLPTEGDSAATTSKLFLPASDLGPPFYFGIWPLLRLIGQEKALPQWLLDDDCGIELHPCIEPARLAGCLSAAWDQERKRAALASVKTSGCSVSCYCCSCGPRGLQCKNAGRPSFLRTMFAAYRHDFTFLAIPKLCRTMAMILGPVCLGELLRAVEEERAEDTTKWALLLFSCRMAAVICDSFEQWWGAVLSAKCRCGVMSSAVLKSLRLDPAARAKLGMGFLTNVMGGDMITMGDVVGDVHNAWQLPLQLVVALFTLVMKVGWLGIAATLVMAAFAPFNAWVVRMSKKVTAGNSEARDARIKTMSAALHGIKVVKMHAWEDALLELVARLRKAELYWVRMRKKIMVINNVAVFATPALLPMLIFSGSVALGREVTPSLAFSSLAILDVIQGPMNEIPRWLSRYVEMLVAVERFRTLFLADEIHGHVGNTIADTDKELEIHEPQKKLIGQSTALVKNSAAARGLYCRRACLSGEPAVHLCTGTEFQWESKKDVKDDGEGALEATWSLKVVNELTVSPGSLLYVTGGVGAGKSTLLEALLGEVPSVGGGITLCGSQVTFYQQEPWIQGASIRDNIIFGQEYEPSRFEAVVEACALSFDIKQLEHGDSTRIGEKGYTLSGGQRARLALARACYPHPDVVILDDVLSAVDASTAQHIVNKCLCGPNALLRHATRILAVPAGGLVGILPRADITWRLEDGEVIEDIESSMRETSTTEAQTDMEAVELASREVSEAEANYGKEDQAQGIIDRQVWITFFKTLGWRFLPVFFILYGASSGSVLLSNVMLASWTDRVAAGDSEHNLEFLFGYIGVLILACCIIVLRNLTFTLYGSLRVGTRSHDRTLPAALAAPLSYYHSTPVGRVLNRFSADLQKVDHELFPPFQGVWVFAANIICGVLTLCGLLPALLLLLVPTLALQRYVNLSHLNANREIMRELMKRRGGFIAYYEEAMHGVKHIRTWGVENQILRAGEQIWRARFKIHFMLTAGHGWKNIRLNVISSMLLLAVVLFARLAATMAGDGTGNLVMPVLSAGTLGLMLKYTLQLTNDFQVLLNEWVNTEANFVSFERMHSSANLTSERYAGEEWNAVDAPSLNFDSVELRYQRPSGGEVKALRGVTFGIQPGHSLGVCGRTGAGKSSLINAIFRLTEISAGTVTLNGINTLTMSLKSLRGGLGSIPQEPVLFAGDVRFNLDPMGKLSHMEDTFWKVLEQVGLASLVQERGGLSMKIEVNGDNFSVGEKQLLATARSLLLRPKLLILDEATANVDEATERQIMAAVQQNAGGATTLSIAHRIRTLMPLDEVIVLENGCVKEIGTPLKLMQEPSSAFRILVEAYNAVPTR